MDNQHRKISGYRELSQDEIDLINSVKAAGEQLASLCARVGQHVDEQYQQARMANDLAEMERLSDASALQWQEESKKTLQLGIMLSVRAVEQPTTF